MAIATADAGASTRQRREALRLSAAELARRALVDPTTIARLERGDRVGDLTRARIERALEEAEAAA